MLAAILAALFILSPAPTEDSQGTWYADIQGNGSGSNVTNITEDWYIVW